MVIMNLNMGNLNLEVNIINHRGEGEGNTTCGITEEKGFPKGI
jgi:hypothetical protein